MKEIGIIMSGDHPKKILDNIKTMTRRVIKPQPPRYWSIPPAQFYQGYFCEWGCKINEESIKCPYGQVGDRLWVRETWATENRYNHLKPSEVPRTAKVFFLADGGYSPLEMGIIRPPLFMPKWVARIWREITGLRAEGLQEITEEDAQAEGFGWYCGHPDCLNGRHWARGAFFKTWDSLNAKRGYGVDKNPWVWVINYRRLEA